MLRQAYQDSIKKDAWISNRYNQQVQLRKGYKWLTLHLDNNIAKLYALPPNQTVELDSILNEYIFDIEFKKPIVDFVNDSFQKK